MNLKLKVECPYCKHVNQVNTEFEGILFSPVTVLCDIDEGGCDKYFVYSVMLSTNITVRAIDGEHMP